MELTDHQWHLIQHLIPPPRRISRGRPPLDRRTVLQGVLWKLSTASPRYNLPDRYPGWGTCYHYYRQWGLIDQIHRRLYQDLRQRGGLDLFRLIRNGSLPLVRRGSRWFLDLPPELQNSWQSQTAQLLLQ
jgi:transposase